MPRGAVTAVGAITALHAAMHVLLIVIEAPAVRHAGDLRVSGEGAAVEGAPAYCHPPAAVPVVSGHLDAGGSREEAVPVLPAAHARPLVEVGVRVVVVEGVVARRVRSVLRRALETSDPLRGVRPDEASHDGGRQEEANGGHSDAIKRGHRSRSSVLSQFSKRLPPQRYIASSSRAPFEDEEGDGGD